MEIDRIISEEVNLFLENEMEEIDFSKVKDGIKKFAKTFTSEPTEKRHDYMKDIDMSYFDPTKSQERYKRCTIDEVQKELKNRYFTCNDISNAQRRIYSFQQNLINVIVSLSRGRTSRLIAENIVVNVNGSCVLEANNLKEVLDTIDPIIAKYNSSRAEK